jgi:hypothetical protein
MPAACPLSMCRLPAAVAKLAQGPRSGSPPRKQPDTWERRSSGLQLLHMQHCVPSISHPVQATPLCSCAS